MGTPIYICAVYPLGDGRYAVVTGANLGACGPAETRVVDGDVLATLLASPAGKSSSGIRHVHHKKRHDLK
jgi:hypothetical protein